MPIHVSLVGRKNLSREIYRQLARAILDGRLRPGDRITPSRELADALDVSRMTVNVAYERLAGEGFVTTRQGAGTFVSELVARKPTRQRSRGAIEPRPVWEAIEPTSIFGVQPLQVRYDFRTGVPDAALFPHQAWQRAVVRALRSSESSSGRYGDPAGLYALREAVARHIGLSRGVEASADDIVIAGGTQQALDLITRVLLAPGDAIAVEEPGYGPARLLFESMGYRVVGVPVDGEGLVVTALPRGARAVYVTPSHQYPLGVVMSLPRRQALLGWAARNDAAIIEDDYDSEFRFGGRPLEPLQSIDAAGRVIYVGTFSKTMLPMLRLGFLVAPPSLRKALINTKYLTDWHTSTLGQVALAQFVEGGGFARHIRKMTGVYRERHALITHAVERDFGEYLTLIPSRAGLHVAVLACSASASQLKKIVARAGERGVALHLLWPRGVDSAGRAGLMLGYGAIPLPRIKEGLRVLRSCFRDGV